MKLLAVCAWMGLGVATVAAWKLADDMLPALATLVRGAGDSAKTERTGGVGGAFVAVPMPNVISSRGIVIFAPANCPSDAAQRADALAGYLSRRGIAFVRSSAAEFGDLSSQAEVDRVMAVMNGPIPVVYVNGRAKANPEAEEVEEEYLRARRS